MKMNRNPYDEKQLEEGLTKLYIPPHMRDAIRKYVLDHRPGCHLPARGGRHGPGLASDLHVARSSAVFS